MILSRARRKRRRRRTTTTTTTLDQDFLELAPSVDSNCARRMIVERLGEEISAKRSNG
jgi:hypothetical protein